MNELPFSLERSILIHARKETVFSYFTDSARFATWWGAGSEIEPRVGGAVKIRYPEGTRAGGEVLEIDPPRLIAFTYGYEGEGKLIPPGGSKVTVTVEEGEDGTLVTLKHDVATEKVRNEHVQGWRYQMAVFSNVVSALQHAGVTEKVDHLFRAWAEPDVEARRKLLESCVTADVDFRDPYSATSGLEDLIPHITAAQFFMPGVVLARDGDLKQCQGTAVARWTATKAGNVVAKGMNVYELAPDGRIRSVVGLWGE
ncbi:MAG TPA: SRPBCC domain-containing protein [Thermoanaerobaculia bacterium]|jgi:uncharacterized protein YndB with AHSA1/START domain|nr:SRPBCC domain-containing protein [Thermoanaerobaculia bacterium]